MSGHNCVDILSQKVEWLTTKRPLCNCGIFPEIFFSYVTGTQNRVNQCPVNEHGCLDLDVCIHMSKLCDGAPDCSDGWDEGPHCRGNKQTQAYTFNDLTCKTDGIVRSLFCHIQTRGLSVVLGQNKQSHLLLFPLETNYIYPIISCIRPLKGIVHRKMKIHSLSTHHCADGGVGEVFESTKHFWSVTLCQVWPPLQTW